MASFDFLKTCACSRLQLFCTAVAIGLLTVIGCSVNQSNSPPTVPTTPPAAPTSPPAPQEGKIFGVTVDSVSSVGPIVDSLAQLPQKATVRVVFDKELSAVDYQSGVKSIHKVANVMGEILDSWDVAAVSLASLNARTSQFLDLLGSDIDIWEVGNEINGEWLGPTPTVVEKLIATYSAVKSRNKLTALTLYYNQDCWKNPQNEVFSWAEKNVPLEMKQNLDYVFLSYYEEDCNGLKPDWASVFQRLGQMFPNSKIGFGETGTTDQADKINYLNRYYAIRDLTPHFVGGYFWWYFTKDMVPATTPLWNALKAAMKK